MPAQFSPESPSASPPTAPAVPPGMARAVTPLSLWSGDTLLFRAIFLLALSAAGLFAGIVYVLRGELPWPQLAVVGAIVAIAGAAALVARSGRTDVAGALLVGGMWCATTIYCVKSGYGLHSAAVFMYMPCMLFTALFFGIWIAAAELALTVAALILMYMAEESGRLGGAAAFVRQGSNLNFLIGVTMTSVGALLAGFVYHRRVEHEAARVAAEAEQRRAAMEAAQLAQAQVESAHARLMVLNGELQAQNSMRYDDAARAHRDLDALYRALAEDLPVALRAGPETTGQLAEQLEALARAATAPLRRAPVDVSALAEEAVSGCHGEFPGVAFSVQTGMRAEADATLLATLLGGLLRRAAVACRNEPGAGVRVGSGSVEGTATFFVRDNGPALDEAEKARLLRPFGRPGATPDAAIPFARLVAERHGGELRIDSTAGRGTSVHFSLPR